MNVRVVIQVQNTSSLPHLRNCEVSPKYFKGHSSYGVNMTSLLKPSEGNYPKCEIARVVILVHGTFS